MRAVRTTGVRATPADDAEQVTQLLPGDYAEVRESAGEWLRVTVPGQASTKDPAGYPGWVRRADLAFDEDSVVEIARGLLGVPYVWGGLTDAGIDCSGLVHLAFRAVGVVVPRDAHDQASAATSVSLGEERPGDLWFFAAPDDPDGPVTHVGFVTGPGRMLHASSRAGEVVEEPVDDARRATLLSSGRFGAPSP